MFISGCKWCVVCAEVVNIRVYHYGSCRNDVLCWDCNFGPVYQSLDSELRIL